MNNNRLILNIQTSLILGVSGEIGQLLLNTFVSFSKEIIGIDKDFNNIVKNEKVKYIKADLNLLSSLPNEDVVIQKAKSADYIVICLPEQLSISILNRLFPYIKDGTTIIDTLAVKQNYLAKVNTLINQSNKKIKILSIHPLFKPALGFKNNNVIVITREQDKLEKKDKFMEAIRNRGANITLSTFVEHDQMMSVVQALTHILILSFGLTLIKINYDSKKFKNFTTPLQQNLFALLSRITNGNAHVYWDIQAKNQFNQQLYQNLKQSLDHLSKIIDEGNEEEFNEIFINIKNSLKLEVNKD